MVNRLVPDKKNPFLGKNAVQKTKITVGAESANVITATLQLQSAKSANRATRGRVRAYLSNDANGDSLLPSYLMPNGGFAIHAAGQLYNGPQHDRGVYQKGTLAIDATAQDFKTTTTTVYRAKGAQWTKAATTAIAFTAAHVVSANKFGVVLVQIDKNGTIGTKVSNATQAFNSAALALAALPAPDADNAVLGYITIAAGGGGFTANTTALTGISTFVDAPEICQYPPSFDLISDATGKVDIDFTETGIKTFYLVVMNWDGSLTVSSAITFA